MNNQFVNVTHTSTGVSIFYDWFFPVFAEKSVEIGISHILVTNHAFDPVYTSDNERRVDI